VVKHAIHFKNYMAGLETPTQRQSYLPIYQVTNYSFTIYLLPQGFASPAVQVVKGSRLNPVELVPREKIKTCYFLLISR